MLTWLYDSQGHAGAILDEFCIRSVTGDPVAWVFGLSVFSLHGEHIGWYENGLFFDVANQVVGFIPGLARGGPELPVPAPPPPVPPFPKRPNVPPLRARPVRRPASGWSQHRLADYLDGAAAAFPAAPFAAAAASPQHGAMGEISP